MNSDNSKKRRLEGRTTSGVLWEVTHDDCDWQTVESAVRCIHRASGASGEALDSQKAFIKMLQTDVFKQWSKAETARRRIELGFDESQ
jgi:hypothetical protein